MTDKAHVFGQSDVESVASSKPEYETEGLEGLEAFVALNTPAIHHDSPVYFQDITHAETNNGRCFLYNE